MSNERIELDRSAFSKTLRVKALRIPPRRSSEVRSRVQDHLLSIKRLKSIRNDPQHSKKLVLLDSSVTDDLPEDIQRLVEEEDVELIDYDLSMGYESLSAAEVLRAILPEDITIPSAFETIGHVAHLNLRSEHAPYRHAIAQVLLDKNPIIKTVINKVGTLENAYRLMDIELLAGDPSLETEVRQNNCRFRLDFGKVYWNSRLEFEHARLVDEFCPGDNVLDLMSGIGPFAIPAAKAGCYVIANDKNPESYRYLKENAELNDVGIVALNLDARFCLRLMLGLEGDLCQRLNCDDGPSGEASRKRRGRKDPPKLPFFFQHVIMNYPQFAISFLDMFHGVFDRQHWPENEMPIVHCYAFMHADENEAKMKEKCEEALGGRVFQWTNFHIVRKVSPSKSMCCISFRLPAHVAWSPTDVLSKADMAQGTVDEISDAEISGKKRRCNDG